MSSQVTVEARNPLKEETDMFPQSNPIPVSLGFRGLVKLAFRFLAHVFVFPYVIWHWLWVPVLGRDRCVEGSTQFFSLVPGVFGEYLRRAFLYWAIENCHPSAVICFGTLFSKYRCRIGENVYVGPRCHLGMVDLQRDVLLAAGTHITSGAHVHGDETVSMPIREQEGKPVLVTIGAGSWIGSNAVVMADVGADCVIGAGAVVTKPILKRSVAVGVPARVVRTRTDDV
jgi:acetyltransferase-like isoleucine patch superfamily enzyme